MMNPYYSGWVAEGIENNANSVQFQLQLPTGTELGNKTLVPIFFTGHFFGRTFGFGLFQISVTNVRKQGLWK